MAAFLLVTTLIQNFILRQVMITGIDRNDQPNGGMVRVRAAIYAISLRHNPELIDWRTTMTYNSILVYRCFKEARLS